MPIRDLFIADVTRDIPPVVYFHEQSPEKLASEVAEYIITGGYPEGDPRARRVRSGIHEQFVHLLKQIHHELKHKKGGPELPASWISGFYGSGKSSFAKLLGLALDGVVLPDGRTLAQALLARDDSPKAAELVDAWNDLLGHIKPLAVVFDIGAVARDNEHIHSAVLRQVQARLGYCRKSHLVAEHELKLEKDGEWELFLETARRTLKRPWEQAREDEQAEDHFSHVLHVMKPERYLDPTSWIDSRAGARTGGGTSVREVAESIATMLDSRAPGRALFLVVDEVSQYVHQDESRMLKLQSFVSELGQRFKGGVWLLATGQQKLEDTSESISKLKDRFPPHLRVHLATTNIRDVVHKRLLKKAPQKEKLLRDLFQRHRSDLKLHGYGCEEITEEDFVEVYPMLPAHVDLLMQITTQLRSRSSRVQGDDHAIRGLLQLLGELFRELKLAEREVGELVTLDAIFEIQQSALDADVQATLARFFNHPEAREDKLAQRMLKAVALLELIQEQLPTTAELVAKCLYERLGQGSQVSAVTDTLERLRNHNLLSYSEKYGYKLQSTAGQEWQRERDDLGVSQEQISELAREKLGLLIDTPDRVKLKGRPFPWSAWYSDGKQAHDVRLKDPRDEATVSVDFRFLGTKEERNPEAWVQRSNQEGLSDRLIWVVGEPGQIREIGRELARSQHMIRRYDSRKDSLPPPKQRLLIDERTRSEELEKRMQEAVATAFLDGSLYFRGRAFAPRESGSAFGTALHALATRLLPELYPYFTEVAVTETELSQLLEPTLSGPSNKFLEGGLGILSLDAGRYVPSCEGAQPSRILQYITEQSGASGAAIIAHFGKPPFGYPVDVVRACLAGLVRAGKIRIRPETGPEITSIRDPGTKDLFRRERDLRRADFFPPKEQSLTPRDRIAICKLFKDYLDQELERENDTIADAVFQWFPGRREQLREVEVLLNQLPKRPPLPPALERLARALEDCRRSRQVEETLLAVKKHLDALADGFQQLGIYRSELIEQAIQSVREADEVREHQLAQLRHVGEQQEVAREAEQLDQELKSERPWRAAATLEAASERIRKHYVDVRRALLTAQGKEAEAAMEQLKRREGFARLSADEIHRVLRPLNEALVETSPEASYPTLVELRDSFRTRLQAAFERANDLLDELLSRSTPDSPQPPTSIVKLEARISGREIANKQQLQALLKELEERITAQLDKGMRVRLT